MNALDSDQDMYDTVIMRHAPIEPFPYIQYAMVILKLIICQIAVVRGVLQLYHIVSVTCKELTLYSYKTTK